MRGREKVDELVLRVATNKCNKSGFVEAEVILKVVCIIFMIVLCWYG